MKPSKWHFRQYSLNDSSSGYLLCFHLYRGKCEKYPTNIKPTVFPAYILTSNNRLQHNNHILVIDRFYSGIQLLHLLQERGIDVLGTIMTNRLQIEKKLLIPNNTKNIARGEFRVFLSGDKSYKVISWKDNKVVTLYTSLETGYHFASRKGQNGQKIEIKCPTAISMYTAKMRGTDVFDQRMTYFWPFIRTLKWTNRVFIHMFYIAVVNSHILYKKYFNLTRGDENFELASYITTLMHELGNLNEEPQVIEQKRQKRKRDTLEADPDRTKGTHTPVNIGFEINADGEAEKVNKRVNCAYCKQGRVSIKCEECNVGLHIGSAKQMNCFGLFHTEEKFSYLPKTNHVNDELDE